MMFKKKMILLAALALAAASQLCAQQVTIDAALANAVSIIGNTVPKGTKVAVLNMRSDYQKLSDYIIDELIVRLVNTGQFQVLPRSAVEMELAKGEMNFQYSGDVSDESQKSLGQYLGAGTIISGSVTRDSVNSYRMLINAIDVESFTYQASNRIAVADDSQMKQLVEASGGAAFYQDYTVGQRLGIGATNIFFGLGSLLKGQKSGWWVTTLELLGGGLIALSQMTYATVEDHGIYDETDVEGLDMVKDMFNATTIVGIGIVGTGVVLGFILPFALHKPVPATADAPDFPLDLRLVSAQNGELGARLTYRVSF